MDSALMYATSTACSSIQRISDEELRSFLQLPKESFQGHVTLQKTELALSADASDSDAAGCELELKVQGNLKKDVVKADNVFDATRTVDANMAQMVKNSHLRGAMGLNDLLLTSVSVRADNKKQYKLVMTNSKSDHLESQLTQYGPMCALYLSKLGLDNILHELVPEGVNAGAHLTARTGSQEDTTTLVSDPAKECGVMLQINAEAFDAASWGSKGDAMGHLKAMDANADIFFASNRDGDHELFQLVGANVELHAPPLLTETNMVLAAQLNEINVSGSAPQYNAPTKQLTLGILAGLSGLCAMLVLVVMKKNSHEKHCRDKYRNASQAAQIRRVSISMSPIKKRSMDEFVGHDSDNEEKEDEEQYEEFGEDDRLL
uniref:Uncharacterized protein n=1 Tax=Globisporangium ultimum (strain ATCC 200006 / CBS 805.95 / DAOM BR144) TaxID=431595 RepID=K3WPX7_GLOUD